MNIIPAIDIIDGKCVRLSKGDYNTKKIYNENPLEVAKMYENHGIKHIHLVDLDGAKSKHIINGKVLESICTQTKLKVDFGGGIKSDEDVYAAFEYGAHQITGGSVAVHHPETFKNWIKLYGGEKIIVGADCKNRAIATNGWQNISELDVIEFIKFYKGEGAKYVICTDIDKDGMLQGASFNLYVDILTSCEIKLIASGGISSINDLKRLKEIGCDGAIIGKALYENKITLKELESLC